jgi:hypothetical protein
LQTAQEITRRQQSEAASALTIEQEKTKQEEEKTKQTDHVLQTTLAKVRMVEMGVLFGEDNTPENREALKAYRLTELARESQSPRKRRCSEAIPAGHRDIDHVVTTTRSATEEPRETPSIATQQHNE